MFETFFNGVKTHQLASRCSVMLREKTVLRLENKNIQPALFNGTLTVTVT